MQIKSGKIESGAPFICGGPGRAGDESGSPRRAGSWKIARLHAQGEGIEDPANLVLVCPVVFSRPESLDALSRNLPECKVLGLLLKHPALLE